MQGLGDQLRELVAVLLDPIQNQLTDARGRARVALVGVQFGLRDQGPADASDVGQRVGGDALEIAEPLGAALQLLGDGGKPASDVLSRSRSKRSAMRCRRRRTPRRPSTRRSRRPTGSRMDPGRVVGFVCMRHLLPQAPASVVPTQPQRPSAPGCTTVIRRFAGTSSARLCTPSGHVTMISSAVSRAPSPTCTRDGVCAVARSE